MRRFVLYAVVLAVVLCAVPAGAYVPIIDAGHGGFDGGAIASNGVIESSLNLEISMRIAVLFRFLGIEPVLTRENEGSLASGDSKGRSAKNEDLAKRVSICDAVEDGFLISIHQNNFSDSRYGGLHAFYSRDAAKPLALAIQQTVKSQIDTANNREPKTVPSGVYLFKRTTRPAVLVECGFLSNANDLALLQTAAHQKKLACVVVGEFIRFNALSSGITE